MDFASSGQVKNWTRWKNIVAKLYMVSRRSSKVWKRIENRTELFYKLFLPLMLMKLQQFSIFGYRSLSANLLRSYENAVILQIRIDILI